MLACWALGPDSLQRNEVNVFRDKGIRIAETAKKSQRAESHDGRFLNVDCSRHRFDGNGQGSEERMRVRVRQSRRRQEARGIHFLGRSLPANG